MVMAVPVAWPVAKDPRYAPVEPSKRSIASVSEAIAITNSNEACARAHAEIAAAVATAPRILIVSYPSKKKEQTLHGVIICEVCEFEASKNLWFEWLVGPSLAEKIQDA